MMAKQRILVVDDDETILNSLRLSLTNDGFEVIAAHSGSEALSKVERTLPQLAILDLMLPGMSGFELSKRLQRYIEIPVIMLTAVTDEETVVQGLEQYADDYINKPFRYAELRARINRILSRANEVSLSSSDDIVVDNNLVINFARHSVVVGQRNVHLSPIESRLLYCLVKGGGRVVSNESLLRRGWNYQDDGDIESLWVRMSSLRRKLGDIEEPPRYIITERGVGYRFGVPIMGVK